MTAPSAARRAGLLDRLIAATPLLSAYLWVVVLLAWQSREQRTPWLFVDEHQYSAVARSIAATGRETIQGHAQPLHTVYPYLIAPLWRIADVPTAYAATKYLDVLVMAAVVFPTYFLARLAVGVLPALFAAVTAGLIPAMTYSAYIIQEPLAYPYATTCLWLIARWLVLRTRKAFALALAASLLAPLVRDQLVVLPGSIVLLGLALGWSSDRFRRWRQQWTAGDWLGASVLAILGLVVVNRLLGVYSAEWHVVSESFKGRIVEHGVWALGALTIGIGIVPLVLGIAGVGGRLGRGLQPGERALALVLAFCGGSFWLYAAVKSAYLSTQPIGTRVAERNLIYVAPLLLAGTALAFQHVRLRLWPLLGGAVLALIVVTETPNHARNDFQFDAPGLSIGQAFNRNYRWDEPEVRRLFVALVLLGAVVGLLPRLLSVRAATAVFAAVAVGVVGWSLTGEIAAAGGTARQSKPIYANLSRPLDWIDRATRHQPSVFIGQTLGGDRTSGVFLLEFWNRSIKEVWSLDGSAPPPTLTPDYDGFGRLLDSNHRPIGDRFEYVVADGDIAIVGKVVAQRRDQTGGGQRVWKVTNPLTLQFAAKGIQTDGWIIDGRSSYSQFATPGYKRVDLVVSPNRGNICPPKLRTRVIVRVGQLAIDDQRQPSLGRIWQTQRATIRTQPDGTCEIEPLRFRNLKAPFQVEVRASPSFTPAEVDAKSGDKRELTIRVGYGIEPVS